MLETIREQAEEVGVKKGRKGEREGEKRERGGGRESRRERECVCVCIREKGEKKVYSYTLCVQPIIIYIKLPIYRSAP